MDSVAVWILSGDEDKEDKQAPLLITSCFQNDLGAVFAFHYMHTAAIRNLNSGLFSFCLVLENCYCELFILFARRLQTREMYI